MPGSSTFWCGNEHSLKDYFLALARPIPEAFNRSDYGRTAPAQASRLTTVVGDIAVVEIRGALVDSADAELNAWRGVTGYPEIRQAMVEAANNPSVKGILLDIKSGGGSVSGVQDTADLIASVDQKVKPVAAHTDGMMASAAYWLGVSAGHITNGVTAEVGSIGVLTVHQDMSKLLADVGITATVLRAGEFKALGHPVEPLSDKARAEIQASLDQMMSLFTGHVAAALGKPYATVDSTMGQGRVFLGAKAAEVGLTQGVMNFDAALSRLQGEVDKGKLSPKYGANTSQGSSVKHALTEQQVAAIAAGASVGTDPAAGLGAPAAPLPVAAPAEPEAVAVVPTPEAAAPAAGELTAYLQGQLASAQAQVMELTIAAREKDEKIKGMDASLSGFRAIAQDSVKNMKVALNLPAIAATTDAELLAEHTTVRTQFTQSFKAGGVAAVSSQATDTSKTEAAVDSTLAARIASTRSK